MMSSLKSLLVRATSSVSNPSPAQQKIIAKLAALQARLDEGLLRVAVLGQFKRGKSTLLNALLGRSLLPVGIIPVTAIPTFISAGAETKGQISFGNGQSSLVISGESEIQNALEAYTSEARNPHNRLQVERVEIEIPSDFLDRGIQAIDTPGVGSTFLHNTQTAQAVLSECDAALFVLSADPPITEVELNYLRDIQKLIPKVFFILNKTDTLDAQERQVAEDFLARVLAQESAIPQPAKIFCISARQGLQAKESGDAKLLAESGLQRLQGTLTEELAREKRNIVFTVVHMRASSLLEELLFQSELEHKALLLPQEELTRKAAIFEESAKRFEEEQRNLADFMLVDRNRLLKELEAETDRLWTQTQGEIHQLLKQIASERKGEKEAREQLETALTQKFEHAFPVLIETCKAKLQKQIAVHQERASNLVQLVRQTAANLMEIPVTLPRLEEAFEAKRTPYWVAAEASVSIIALSAGALTHLMPKNLRERRLYRQLTADAERAVLRNIANLQWAMKQNIQDSFLHFQSALSEQLENALTMTRGAFRLALEQRSARSETISSYVREVARSIRTLEEILAELLLSPT